MVTNRLAELSNDLRVQKLPNTLLTTASQHLTPDGKLQARAINPRKADRRGNLVDLSHTWEEAGVPPLVIAQYLSTDSQWLRSRGADELLQALDDQPMAVIAFLQLHFGQLYAEVVQHCLNARSHPEHGFNDHSLVHIQDLLDSFAKLSQHGGYSQQEKIAVHTAIFTHDMGNAVSRETHQILSAYLFLASFDRELATDPFLAQCMRAVMWHEAGSVNGQVEHLLRQQDEDQLSSLELLDQFGSKFSRVDSSLRLLDKLSIGRKRVLNGQPAKWNRLVDDAHFLVNALFERDSIEFDQTGHKCRVTFEFSLYPNSKLNVPELIYPKHHRKIDSRSKLSQEEFFVSEQMRRAYREGKRVYFESATATLLSLYQDRITLIALDFFNIFPELDEVELYLVDPHEFFHQTDSVWPNHEQLIRNEPIILRFQRSVVAEQLRHFQSYTDDIDPRQFVNQINSLTQKVERGSK